MARGAQLRNRAKQTHQDITLPLTNTLSGEHGLTTMMDFSKCVCGKTPLKGVAAMLRWRSYALEATEGPLLGIGHVESTSPYKDLTTLFVAHGDGFCCMQTSTLNPTVVHAAHVGEAVRAFVLHQLVRKMYISVA